MVSADDFEVVDTGIPKPAPYAPESVDLTPHINAAATRFKLDPAMLQRLVSVESGGNVRAVSPAGALGAFQIMPQTAKLLGYQPEEMYDPAKAAMAAGQYLSDSRDRFSQYTQDPNELNDMVIASYNAGPNAVENAVKRGGARWRTLVPRDRYIDPKGTQASYLDKVRGALPGASSAEASDFEVIKSAGAVSAPAPKNRLSEETLNPAQESTIKTAWARLTDPRNIREGGLLGVLRNIQEAGGEIGAGLGEAYGNVMEKGGPISRMWESALPSGPEGETGRALREQMPGEFRRGGEVVGEMAADPLMVGPLAASRPLRVLRRLEVPASGIISEAARAQAGRVLGPARRPAPEPVVKRGYAPEPPIIAAPPAEPVASDFEVLGEPRIPATAELPTAAQVRPEYGPQRPLLFDDAGRPLPRQPIGKPAPEPSAPEPLNVGILRDTKDIAERRTGGPIPQRPTELRSAAELHAPVEEPVELGPPNRVPRTKQYEEPVVITKPVEEPASEPFTRGEGVGERPPVTEPEAPLAAQERPEFGPEKPRLFDAQGRPTRAETPTERLIRKGGNISGAGDVFGREDVGWTSPAGKHFSFEGKRNARGQMFTHSEAIQDIHGQQDIGQALNDGWVRWATAGDHLNIETGPAGIDNAIKVISDMGRKSRGGVIVEYTDAEGALVDSKIFDRPYQAIEYLKSYQKSAEAPRTLRRPPQISGGSGQYSVEVEFANGGSRVVGTAENEAAAMRLAAQYAGADAKNVHVTMPDGTILNSRNPMGLKDSGMILKELERRGIDDSLQGYKSVLPTITDTNQAKRIIKGDQALLDQLLAQARGIEVPRPVSPAQLPPIYGQVDTGIQGVVNTLRERGYPTVHSSSGALNESSVGQAGRPYVAFDYAKMGSNQLNELEQTMKAAGWVEDSQFFGEGGTQRAWRPSRKVPAEKAIAQLERTLKPPQISGASEASAEDMANARQLQRMRDVTENPEAAFPEGTPAEALREQVREKMRRLARNIYERKTGETPPPISGGSDAAVPSETIRWKRRRSTNPTDEGVFDLTVGDKTYPVYWDSGSRSWRSLDLLNKGGAVSVDHVGFSKAEVIENIKNGTLDAKLARYVQKPPISGGSDADVPLMSAREKALRRSEPKPEPTPEAPKVEPKAAPTPEVPTEPEVAGPRKPPGKRGLRDTLRSWLPQERAVLRDNPNSPVISAVERRNATMADELSRIVNEPSFKKVLEMDPEQIKALEVEADRIFNAGGRTPEAFEAAIKDWPAELKDYVRRRNASLAEENAARERLGMKPFPETAGPYIPRIADADAKEAFRLARGSGGSDLQTSLRGAERSRSFSTTRQGEARGITYLDPRNSILLREYNGLQVRTTEKLINELKSKGALFESEAAAQAASPTKEAFLVEGVPGNSELYAPTRAEAQFLVHNLKSQPGGIELPGGLSSAKHYLDTWLRNPNLINPLPHAVKNMGFKQLIAGGPVGITKLPRDMVEFFRGSNPKLMQLFKEYMPYADNDPAYHTLQQYMHKTGGAKMYRTAADLVRTLNQGSSKVIFKWADPSMRYSLFKHYIEKGMAPQEAANNAWIDLVRYATRSDLVDFWKSIPSNFFVPWRVGTWTSVLKNMAKHPFRTALLIGGIDLAREIRYRHTGRWSHWPHDYIEGPISLVLEDAIKGQPARTGWQAMINAALGPGGEATASAIARMFTEPNADTDAMKSILKSLWGIGQLLPTGDMLQELGKFKDTGDVSHITNALGALIFAERQVYKTTDTGRRTGFEPHRFLKAVPEADLPKDYTVKYNELVTGKQHK